MNATVQYLWAPRCMKCKAMAPHVDAIAEEFAGSVELERIDLSEFPEVAARLSVMATPTIIGRRDNTELFRVSGRRTPTELREMFSAVAAGSDAVAVGGTDRMLRVGSGVSLALVGALLGPAWPLVVVGLGIALWGWIASVSR